MILTNNELSTISLALGKQAAFYLDKAEASKASGDTGSSETYLKRREAVLEVEAQIEHEIRRRSTN